MEAPPPHSSRHTHPGGMPETLAHSTGRGDTADVWPLERSPGHLHFPPLLQKIQAHLLDFRRFTHTCIGILSLSSSLWYSACAVPDLRGALRRNLLRSNAYGRRCLSLPVDVSRPLIFSPSYVMYLRGGLHGNVRLDIFDGAREISSLASRIYVDFE